MTFVDPAGPDANDPLMRLSDLAEGATDAYASAVKAAAEKEIEYRREWDDAFSDSEEKSVAARERFADEQSRDQWAEWRRADAEEKAADKALRAVLGRLSAFQTYARSVGVQT